MVTSYPTVWKILLLSSWVAALLSWVWPVALSHWAIAMVLILLVGIPHGAADHRLFQQLYSRQLGRGAMYGFYAGYLSLMAAVGLAWWLWSAGMLVLFVLLSAYHFGQGNFNYVSGQSFWHKLYFLAWGLWVIATPVLLHYNTATPILAGLLGQAPGLPLSVYDITLFTAGSGVVLWLLSWLLSRATFWLEGLSFLSLWVLFFYCPLLLGFAIYFAGWHALPSVLDQIQFLRYQEDRFSVKKYTLVVWPYTILALLGMAAIAFLASHFGPIANVWSIIFAFIAAVTLPHMLVLDRVYDWLDKKRGLF